MTAPDRVNIHALLERVRSVAGPDRELDASIAVTFLADAKLGVLAGPHATAAGTYWSHPPSLGAFLCIAERYTSSTDAALALLEAALPGWDWAVWKTGASGFGAGIAPDIMRRGDGETREGDMPTSSLALLAAVFAAILKKA